MTSFKLIVLTEYLATEDEIMSIFRPHHLRVLKTREFAWRFHLNSMNGLLSAYPYSSQFPATIDPMPGWIVAFSSIQDVNKALAICNLRFIPNSTPPNQVFIFQHGSYESFKSPHHSIHIGYTARIVYHLPDEYYTDAALYDLLQPFGGVIHLVYVLRGVGGIVHFRSDNDAEMAEATARRVYPTLEFRPIPYKNIKFSRLWKVKDLQQSHVSPIDDPHSFDRELKSYDGSFLYSDSLVRGVQLFLGKARERPPVSISSASPSKDDTGPANSRVPRPPADPLLIFYTLSWIHAFILMLWSGLSDIVRKRTLPTIRIRTSVQANSRQKSPESGHDPRIQDMASGLVKSIMRLNETFLDMVLGSTGSVLTDLIDQNRKDLQALSESTNSCVADLENKLLERMQQIQKLEGVISVLNKKVHQANVNAHTFREAKERNDQEHNEVLNKMRKSFESLGVDIKLLGANIKQLQECLVESQAHCRSIDEDSLQWRARCRTAEGKVARLTYRIENGEGAIPDNGQSVDNVE